MLLHVKDFVKNIQKGQLKNATQGHILSGLLAQLCKDKESFFELLFPGSSLEARKTFPQNLQELLLWPELVLDLTATARAAAKVLAGVEARGARSGSCGQALLGARSQTRHHLYSNLISLSPLSDMPQGM